MRLNRGATISKDVPRKGPFSVCLSLAIRFLGISRCSRNSLKPDKGRACKRCMGEGGLLYTYIHSVTMMPLKA